MKPIVALITLLLIAGFVAIGTAAEDVVTEVRSGIARKDWTSAATALDNYRKRNGESPESLLALSWMARGRLAEKDYAKAEALASDTYQRVAKELKKRPLDREPNLPLALGASIEVAAQAMAAQGARTEAVQYLESELAKYGNTSIHARVRKNINLLSLEGKPAPALKGMSLPSGKPTVLFFWAHWCGDCRGEIPVLTRLKQEYGSQGVAFLGPTQKYGYTDDGDALPAVEVRHIERVRQQFYSSLVPAPAVVNEENFRNYGVSTTPTLAMVDRKGIVRLYHPGAMTYEELRASLDRLLKY